MALIIELQITNRFLEEKIYSLNHAWGCDGPCQNRPPAFGMIQKKSDRAPGTRNHAKKCHGTFRKFTPSKIIELLEQHDWQVPEDAAFMKKLAEEVTGNAERRNNEADQRQIGYISCNGVMFALGRSLIFLEIVLNGNAFLCRQSR